MANSIHSAKSPFTVEEYDLNQETGEITMWHNGTSSVRELIDFQYYRSREMKVPEWQNTLDMVIHQLTHAHTISCLELSMMLHNETSERIRQEVYDAILDEAITPSDPIATDNAAPSYEDAAMADYYDQLQRRDQQVPYDPEEAYALAH